MRNALAILAALALTGCGDYTRADFERWHPWSQPIPVIPASPENGMMETVVYVDRIPRMDFSSHVVTYEGGIHVVTYDQRDMATSRRWQRHQELKP